MDRILQEVYDKCKKYIDEIFINPDVIIPNNKLNNYENKNAVIKYCSYSILVIAFITKNWKLIIFIFVILLIVEILGSKIITTYNHNQIKLNPARCRKSTLNNPMGNVLLYTKDNELEYSLCNNQDQQINSNLNHNIYYDSKDLFQKKNNIRPFITMPSQNHPNNIDKYKNYLYFMNNPTCKIDNIGCII